MRSGLIDDRRDMKTNSTTGPLHSSQRKSALWAGISYLITFLSLLLAYLYISVRDKSFVTTSGSDAAVIFGGVLEIIVALAGIGSAVALYPVVKSQSQGRALGLIASRIVEASTMFTGVMCLLSVITLRQIEIDTLAVRHALVVMHDWFRLGQNLMPAVNALLLGSLLYQSRLVPRILPSFGLIGAPLLIANSIVLMFGITNGPLYVLTAIGVIPIAIWEFSLGIRLTFWGFDPKAAAALAAKK